MSQSLATPPVMVETPAALAAMLDQLKSYPIIAVDTESNSLYVYQERVCLIQISTLDTDYIVDALALDDISGLGPIFADPCQEKVFHGADYDVGTLRRDYGFEFVNIFDTMVASRILGLKRYGLASLLGERFDVHLNKKMQRHNWGRRPLDREALEYARLDTHYLLPLRDQLQRELQHMNREHEAREAFDRVAQSTWNQEPFSPNSFWRVRGVKTLDDEERGILKALFLMREERARHVDRPPFKVLSDRTMVEISRQRPASLRDLNEIPGLSTRQIRNLGRRLLQAVESGRRDPQPWSSRPTTRAHRRDDDVAERYEQLRAWRRKRATNRGVEPDVIISNSVLWLIAERAPTDLNALQAIDEMGEYQINKYGEELLAALRG